MSLVASIHQQDWETNATFGPVKSKTLFGKERSVDNSQIAMGYAVLESSEFLVHKRMTTLSFIFVPEVVPLS